jgi:quercetin dioxygenase-like cupin family protein
MFCKEIGKEIYMLDVEIIGPVGIRTLMLEKACQMGVGHAHNYDHTTFVFRGAIRVSYRYDKDGRIVEGIREVQAGDHIAILAHVEHQIKALVDNTMYKCVFSHRDFEGLVTQDYHGHDEAYV